MVDAKEMLKEFVYKALAIRRKEVEAPLPGIPKSVKERAIRRGQEGGGKEDNQR